MIAREFGFEVIEYAHVLYGHVPTSNASTGVALNKYEEEDRMTSKPETPDTIDNVAKVKLHPRISVEQVEEGWELAPKFDEHGLIACVTTEAASGEVLMLGYMNREALKRTIQTGKAHYWSRSRQVLWHKGATSGLSQLVEELRIDDDQDAVWLRVSVSGSGASCHVGYHSCFYRRVPVSVQREKGDELVFTETSKTFDPKFVYGDAPNPTIL